jgi:cell division protein FtsQ
LATSKKRDSVFISTSARDRARVHAEKAGARTPANGRGGARAGKAPSEARALAEARKVQREGRAASQRRATRLRVAGIIAAVIVIVGVLVAIYSSSLFAITSVEVAGNVHVSADVIRSLAKVPKDATLIRFPAEAVVASVSADPWVAEVSVSRVFPNGMRIRITERVPVAIVDAGAAMWLIDGTGMVIAKPSAEDSATVPLIRDVPGLDLKAGRRTVSEPLLNAVAVLAGVGKALAATVKVVSAPTVDGATLITADKVEIVMGQAVDLSTKSALATRILQEQKGKVVSIDVRVIDRPTWRGLK